VNVLAKLQGEPSILRTLLIHLKRRDSLEKWAQVFAFWRFINMSRLLRGICKLKMPPANEITKPLVFTVRKVELHCKAIVFQSCFRCVHFRPVVNNKGQNREKWCATKQEETEEQLLKRDYKKALLTDMKSQIESIWYRISILSCSPWKDRWEVHAFWGLWHLDALLIFMKKNLFFQITLNNEL